MSVSTPHNQSQSHKYSQFPSNCNNILQPKRVNVLPSDVTTPPRRILGQKGQLPIPVSQLSNQQLTTLLRNSPLLPHPPVGQEGCGGVSQPTPSGPKRAPNTMAKRNARERNRVKQVNQGFQTLRQHIPESYRMKKMSKVDTLRCALDYIRNMERILQEDESQYQAHGDSSTSTVSPSTTLSFSSEEDDYLVYSAFSGDFTPSSNPASPTGNDAINTKEMEQCKNDLFGSRIISSSNGYNDENNDENLDLDMKLKFEVTPQECGILNHNPAQRPFLGEGHDQKKISYENQEDVGMEIVEQNQPQRLRLLSGQSDTENNYCPEQEIKIKYELGE